MLLCDSSTDVYEYRRAFRTGKAPILIATGISARGWDVKDCHHVINYDLPSMMYGGITEYIHRIGRTGRIGNKGMATSFYNDRDEELAGPLVKVLVHCGQEVPDFLASHKPEDDGAVDFEDDSGDEDEADGGEGFGSEANGFGDAAAGGDEAPAAAWGTPATGADTGFTAAEGAPVAAAW